ncbi:MAG: hypothetical protein COA43_08605 [Robiginitomaculum sp.]|nr:MAG: hypothetical protein COA43_08605 [Robiginitomaculum sp.]
MSAVLSLQPSYYEALKRLTLELAGVRLGDDHTFLVETRLSALSRKEGFENLEDMVEQLFSRGQTRLAVQVVSSLLERATRFYDDRKGFEVLGDVVLPKLHPLCKGGKLRILSYGCSSGQEVYSTAILLDRMKDVFPDMDVEVTGVDYPSLALDRAKEGRFTHFEVQRGLPIRHLIDYFDRVGEDWVVKPSLRNVVKFEDHNLLANASELGTYHVVLFRGRLEQYSAQAALRVMRSLSALVMPCGYLLLGTKESLGNNLFGFDHVEGIENCYRKPAKIMKQEEPVIEKPKSKPLVEYSAPDDQAERKAS